jgi:hypothetical protein
MSYYLSVLKDSPSGFWKLDEVSGSVAYDSSGCGNNGSYIGSLSYTKMPLVSGGKHSSIIDNNNYIEFQITKDFSGLSGVGGFGTSETSDNDFSLEIWFHPKNITNETAIFADDGGVGIYWDNGNLIFKIENETIEYSVANYNRRIHAVVIYSVNNMRMFIDGVLVKSKDISINFTNQELIFKCGPANLSESFIIDAPAIYRYALSPDKILNHYLDAFTNTPENIVIPKLGELLKGSEKYQEISTKFVFPAQKDWAYFSNDDLEYNPSSNSIYLKSTSSTGSFTEELVLNIRKDYVSSKIEWMASSGVSVQISSTGEAGTWQNCINGSSLPSFTQGSTFSDNKVIYMKINFDSTNSQKYIPELYYLKVYFYTEKKVYAHNGGSIISISQPTTGNTWDIDISNNDNNILNRVEDNGIRPKDSAFFVETKSEVKNIEFIFTPKSITSGYLFFNKTNGIEYSLYIDSSGNIIKTNISGFYINGQDLSLINNISDYVMIEEPNYILISLPSSVNGSLWLNGKQDAGVRSGVLDDNLYQNIAIYKSDTVDHEEHYNMYIGKVSAYASDSVISLTDDYIKTYSRDKILINNI